tara:strand:- start:1471 stop:2124 length:654 start_codon:yes stop_codon:yes gene_type:complete
MADIKLFTDEQTSQMFEGYTPIQYNPGYNFKEQNKGTMFVQVNVFDENNTYIASLYSNRKLLKLGSGKIWVGEYHTTFELNDDGTMNENSIRYYEGEFEISNKTQQQLYPIMSSQDLWPAGDAFQFKIYKDISSQEAATISDMQSNMPTEYIFVKPNEILALLMDAEDESGPIRIVEANYRIETNVFEDVLTKIGQYDNAGAPVTRLLEDNQEGGGL